MAVKVVDASALAALLFGEPEGAGVATALESASLVAPALIGFELGNVCIKKIRRHPELRSVVLAALDLYPRMAVETVDIDFAGAVRLAEETNLTAYDASYLWLARHLDAELVTLDRRLEVAAKQIVSS